MTRRLPVLLFLLAATVLAATLPACGGGGSLTLIAYFGDTGDLQSRGSVQVADVRVGTIGQITLTEDFRARVVLHIKRGTKVPKSSQAVLRTTSLLGERFVELRAVGTSPPGQYLADGDTVAQSVEQPELELVAQTAVELLGGVSASSVASIVSTGAQALGGRGPQLGALIADLNSISTTLATRTTQIGQVIDNLDRASQSLAAGAPDLSALLANLGQTTTLLATDRNQAVTALAALTHLAKAADYSLTKYASDIDREIRQVDAVTGTVVNSLADISVLIDWLQRFAVDFPKGIQGNYGDIYLRIVPYIFDPRSPK